MSNPFRYFNSSPEVIWLVVMMYVRYPLSLRNVEDLLAERGIDISHETVRFWWAILTPVLRSMGERSRSATFAVVNLSWRAHYALRVSLDAPRRTAVNQKPKPVLLPARCGASRAVSAFLVCVPLPLPAQRLGVAFQAI